MLVLFVIDVFDFRVFGVLFYLFFEFVDEFGYGDVVDVV